jgi:hypothetical protein
MIASKVPELPLIPKLNDACLTKTSDSKNFKYFPRLMSVGPGGGLGIMERPPAVTAGGLFHFSGIFTGVNSTLSSHVDYGLKVTPGVGVSEEGETFLALLPWRATCGTATLMGGSSSPRHRGGGEGPRHRLVVPGHHTCQNTTRSSWYR